MKHLFLLLALVLSEHLGHVRFGEVSVPGVSVQATQGDKTLQAVTDGEGRYALPDVDGTWTIQVEMPGFETLREDVTVTKDSEPTEWDLKLKPLAEINGEAPREFSKESVSTLPALQVSAPEPEVAKGLLINGSVSNGAATDLGLARGLGNNRLTGRSPYKGSLTITGNNTLFDARSFSLTGQNTPRPGYSRLQGSVTLQGPLQIPHLFRKGQFTFNYSRTQNRNASVQTALMPTAAGRGGDFSASLIRAPIDPATGLAFANGMIPQDRISAQARALVGLYPLPNFSGGTRYNYQVLQPPDEAEMRRLEEVRGAKPFCRSTIELRFPNTRITFVGGTMSRLAAMISPSQGGPLPPPTRDALLVVNQTGIPDTETFDFVLEFGADPDSLEERQRIAPEESTGPLGPTIFEALRKLGLTLERGKAAREFIVIDHIERPSPN